MRKESSFVLILLAGTFVVSAAWNPSTAQPSKDSGVAAVYQKDCAKCHGADGKGIKSLEPPDFTDAKWQAANTDKKLAAGITNGEGVMPGFKGKLTPVQINALVKHIRGFAAKGAAKPPAKK